MTKKQETDNALNELRKLGFIVFTANDHRRMPQGLRGFPDHIIFGKRSVITIEDKFSDGEKLLPKQKEFMIHVSNMDCDNVTALVNYGDHINALIDVILKLDGRVKP